MTAPLTALADRVQALTSACREMDLAIMQAISGHPWRWADSRTFEPQTVITWDEYGADAPGNPVCSLEAFTGSLDDAMSRAPTDCWLTIDRYSISDVEGHQQKNWRVWIKKPVGDLEGDGLAGMANYFATGRTPEIALTACILRARAALENSHG